MGKAQNRQLHEGRGTNNYMYKKEDAVEAREQAELEYFGFNKE